MFKKMLLIFILLLITNIAKADVFSFPVKSNIIVKELPEIKNTT